MEEALKIAFSAIIIALLFAPLAQRTYRDRECQTLVRSKRLRVGLVVDVHDAEFMRMAQNIIVRLLHLGVDCTTLNSSVASGRDSPHWSLHEHFAKRQMDAIVIVGGYQHASHRANTPDTAVWSFDWFYPDGTMEESVATCDGYPMYPSEFLRFEKAGYRSIIKTLSAVQESPRIPPRFTDAPT